jgi:hypothetical protein
VSGTTLPTPRRALLAGLFVLATALTCAALVSAAVLVPAPPAALPVIVAAVCVGLPLLVAAELPPALAAVRARRGTALRRRHLARLRRDLERLPETRHPLGL